MNILNKYSKKKTVYLLATVSSGFITVLWLLSKLGIGNSNEFNSYDSINALSAIGTIITLLQVVFYALLIVAIVTAILSAFYFFKKDKQDYIMLGEFIASCISSVLLLLSMSGVNLICKAVRAYLNQDFSAISNISSESAYSALASMATNLEYYLYVSIIVFVLNMVVLLIIKNVIHINNFHYSLQEGPYVNNYAYQETGAGSNTNNYTNNGTTNYNNYPNAPKSNFDFKAFIKSKNGKITVGVIAVAIVAFIGYQIYDNFFNYTEIDLAKNITCEFAGKDGEGYISDINNDIDYDKNNQQLASFVADTRLDYETSYELSNGDEITITVKYSEATAKASKIKVTNNSKTIKVKGLIERYKNAEALPNDLIEKLESEAQDEAEDQFKDGYSTTYEYSLDSMWFAKGDDYDRAIAVYKVDATRTSYWSNEVTQNTYYYALYTGDEINSAYLDDDDSHYWRYSVLEDGQGNDLTTADGVEDGLKAVFDDYSIEKIK